MSYKSPLLEKTMKIKENFQKTTTFNFKQMNSKEANDRFLPLIKSKMERNMRESMELH